MNVRARPLSVLGLGMAITLGASLVASCHENAPQPSTFSESATPSATPSRSPSTSASAATATATRTGTPAQEWVVRRYVETVNDAFDTGDVHALRELSAGSCESCGNVLALIRGIHAGGGHIKGDPHWHLVSAHLVRDEGIVETYVKLASHTVVASKGAEPRKVKAAVVFYEFTVTKTEGRWVVTKILDAT